MKKIQQYIFILIGIVFIGTVVHSAWNTPTTATVGDSTGVPIHTLANPQTKDGALSVQKLLAMGSSTISQQAFFNGAIFGNTNTLNIGGTDATGVVQTVQTTISGILRNTGTTTTLETPTIVSASGDRLCANTSGVLVTCTATNTNTYGKLVVDPNYPSAEIQNIRIDSPGNTGTSTSISGPFSNTTGQFQQANNSTMPATGSSIAYVTRRPGSTPLPPTNTLYIKVKPTAISDKGSISAIDDTGAFFCKNIISSTTTRSWVTAYLSNFKLNGANKFIVVYNPNTRCASGKYCSTTAGSCTGGATLTSGPTSTCVSGKNPNGVGYTNLDQTFTSWECTYGSETSLCSDGGTTSAFSCAADLLNP
jgi:hypothetical protein